MKTIKSLLNRNNNEQSLNLKTLSPEQLLNLSKDYENATNGKAFNYEEAIRCLEAAAKKGNKAAQGRLEKISEVKKKLEEAKKTRALDFTNQSSHFEPQPLENKLIAEFLKENEILNLRGYRLASKSIFEALEKNSSLQVLSIGFASSSDEITGLANIIRKNSSSLLEMNPPTRDSSMGHFRSLEPVFKLIDHYKPLNTWFLSNFTGGIYGAICNQGLPVGDNSTVCFS